MPKFFNVDTEMSCYSDGKRSVRAKIVHKPHNGRAVNQLSLTGEFIRSFISVKAASDVVGRCPEAIRASINGRNGCKQCAGFIWEFKDSPKTDYSLARKKRSGEYKTNYIVLQIDKIGNVVRVCNTLREMSELTCIDKCAISKTIRGVQKQTKGFKFIKLTA